MKAQNGKTLVQERSWTSIGNAGLEIRQSITGRATPSRIALLSAQPHGGGSEFPSWLESGVDLNTSSARSYHTIWMEPLLPNIPNIYYQIFFPPSTASLISFLEFSFRKMGLNKYHWLHSSGESNYRQMLPFTVITAVCNYQCMDLPVYM